MSDKKRLSVVKREFYWLSSLNNITRSVLDLIFGFFELHSVKVVAFTIMAFCCFKVNVLHMFAVILLIFSILMGQRVVIHAFRFIAVYLSFLLITKMAYQTDFIPKLDMEYDCTDLPFEERCILLLTDLEWMGYRVLEKQESLLSTSRAYLLVLLITTLQYVVYVRQKFKRLRSGRVDQVPLVLFPGITRKDADESIVNGLKYLCSYGYYKFGLEVTMTVSALAAAFRKDIMSVYYAFWIVLFFLMRRSDIAVFWPLYMTSLCLLIICQYAMAVGVSPNVCIDYPWDLTEPVSRWLFLASHKYPPDGKKILVDFLVFLFVWRQLVVFSIEKRNFRSKKADSYPGGSNEEVYMKFGEPDFVNPVPDHTMFNKSAVDWIKNCIVSSSLWVTLGFVYWVGVHYVNVLSLGYLIGAFVFLWLGYDICLWKIQKILKWWNVLLAYTVSVITAKTMFELVGCAYLDFLTIEACWAVQLLNLGCSTYVYKGEEKCITSESREYYLDAICLGWLLFQRRLFSSCYFLHQVIDIKAIVRTQSKGAQLIEKLWQEKIYEADKKKKKTLEKIKKTVNRIKEWQKNIQGMTYMEPADHATAVHLGDYYMFDEDFELDEVSESSSSSSEDEEDGRLDRTRKIRRKLTMTEFIESVLKKAADDGTKPQDAAKPAQDTKSRRGQSVVEPRGEASDQVRPSVSKRSKLGTSFDAGSGKRESEGRKEPKLKMAVRFILEFFESICVSLILYFDRYSKDYRYIENAMDEQRTITKLMGKADGGSISSNPRTARKASQKRRSTAYQIMKSKLDEKLPFEKRRRPVVFYQCLISFSFFVMSHTEFLCYTIIFLHQALSPTIMSLPLALCALLWGSLTTIRPTTTFWIVLIAYAEVTILIKTMFRNWIFPWNRNKDYRTRTNYPPVLLGVHRNNTYTTADLFLLFVLFLHRYKMRGLGMWEKTNEEEIFPPKNMGVYREIAPEKDDDTQSKGLEQELENEKEPKDEPDDGRLSVPRLGKWKCTSRVMAGITRRGLKIRTKIKVREIEGRILVTQMGRRLMRNDEDTLSVDEEDFAGEVVLRVYSSGYLGISRDLICRMSCLQHITPIRKFFLQLLDQKGRVTHDFYTPMFFSQFLAFLIIFFGFSHFTDTPVQNRGGDHFYFTQNQVPPMYLLAVFIHFASIIIDRILYLRRNVLGKLGMQVLQVAMVHIWMFLIVPGVTETPFTDLPIPQIYYLITCLYFLMSAYQMRVGYPLRVQGHFLCKKYRFFNYLIFKILQYIPFFNQLRTVLDYTCISTSLSIMEWVKLESIYQLIFENKCLIRADQTYTSRRGISYPKFKKYVPGVSAFCFIVFIMWCPFILFAIFETVSERNPPKMAVLELAIGSFGKVYSTVTSHDDIVPFTWADYDTLKSLYNDNNRVWAFLSSYGYEDVATLHFRFQPLESWEIRADVFNKLNKTIQEKAVPIQLYLSWSILRTERAQIVPSAQGMHEVTLEKTGRMRDQFARAFRGQKNEMFVPNLLPKFLKITNEGNAIPVAGFFGTGDNNPYRNVSLHLIFAVRDYAVGQAKYWEMKEVPNSELQKVKLDKIPHRDDSALTIYTFNEKSIPTPLLNFSRRGIIGLYLSIVFFTWAVVKRFMTKYPTIAYEDMPNVDRILQLCHDIFLARESHEFALEEDLYAKLIFLFRSPETLIKWTRITPRDLMLENLSLH